MTTIAQKLMNSMTLSEAEQVHQELGTLIVAARRHVAGELRRPALEDGMLTRASLHEFFQALGYTPNRRRSNVGRVMTRFVSASGSPYATRVPIKVIHKACGKPVGERCGTDRWSGDYHQYMTNEEYLIDPASLKLYLESFIWNNTRTIGPAVQDSLRQLVKLF